MKKFLNICKSAKTYYPSESIIRGQKLTKKMRKHYVNYWLTLNIYT